MENIPTKTIFYGLTQVSPAKNYLTRDFTMKDSYFFCCIHCQVYLATVFPLYCWLYCVKSVYIRSFSGLYFPMRENADQKNSEHEHFSLSVENIEITRPIIEMMLDYMTWFTVIHTSAVINPCSSVQLLRFFHIT